MLPLGLHAHGLFGNPQPVFGDFLCQHRVFSRINDINPPGHYRHRTMGKRSHMGGGVDSTGQSRHDDMARAAQIVGHLAGHPRAQ